MMDSLAEAPKAPNRNTQSRCVCAVEKGTEDSP